MLKVIKDILNREMKQVNQQLKREQILHYFGNIVRYIDESTRAEELKNLNFSGMERYAYLSLDDTMPSIDMLVNTVLTKVVKEGWDLNKEIILEAIEFSKILRENWVIFLSQQFEARYKHIDPHEDISPEYEELLLSVGENEELPKEILRIYFRTYLRRHSKEVHKIKVTHHKSKFNEVVEIDKKDNFETELGFYLTSFEYFIKRGETKKPIYSMIEICNENKEQGFFDARGFTNDEERKWIGIYCR